MPYTDKACKGHAEPLRLLPCKPWEPVWQGIEEMLTVRVIEPLDWSIEKPCGAGSKT